MCDKLKIIPTYKEKKMYNDFKICFADLETILDKENHHFPVCVCMAEQNSKNVLSFFSVESFINYLFSLEISSIIYFHNLGRFDSIFILNWIVNNNISNVEIIERNNIIYEIYLKREKISSDGKKKSYEIIFRDSYLLIPISLKKIGEDFCQNFKKSEFNYGDINYLWIHDKNKVVEQCKKDCEVLKEGFFKFYDIVFNTFGIKLYNNLTLPSLSLSIFKKNYYDAKKTPISKNPFLTDKFIRRSYKGGISEVFKPYLKNGYCYDANSLYPAVMRDEKFPVGKGRFVEGEEIDLKNFIGFIECVVETKKELNFLTFRHPEKGLITPIGIWKDVYFHKEVIKAVELGYKITFLKGFKYEKEEYIFSSFVNNLYKIRVEANNEALNKISKLILNSLYGRFGMKIFVESTKFIKGMKQINEIQKTYDIRNIYYLGNDFYSFSGIKKSKNNSDLYKNSIDTETAVQIASAITAYSRIFMYDFKSLKNNRCYYTDTDSIFLEKPLDEKHIGEKLKQFKLEYKIKEAYFIAPKVYYVEKDNSNVKVVFKGMKKKEISNEQLLESFKNIIFNNSISFFKFNRENLFKRDFLNLKIYKNNLDMKFLFSFNKRNKIISNNEWIDTYPISIKIL